MPLVFVNILVWNGERWLKKCLDSVLASHYPDFKVLVVDNLSTDNSRRIVEENYPQVELIKNKKNYGFAEGHNIGIRCALKQGADYTVLLNQDIIVDKFWLSELLQVANEQKQFGVLAPIQYDYQGKNIDPLFLRILNQNSEFKKDYRSKSQLEKVYEVPDTFGGAMFFRREVFLKVGLFDPLFFAYSEEIDFFQRAAFHGIRVAVVTTSKVNHWHTSLHSRKGNLYKIDYLATRNKYLAMLKDPRSSLLRNWISSLGHMQQDILRNLYSLKGILKIFLTIYVQLWMIIYLPLIIHKRFWEKKRPCYL